MLSSPKHTFQYEAQARLVDAVIAEYHTTRMSEVKASDHILASATVQARFAALQGMGAGIQAIMPAQHVASAPPKPVAAVANLEREAELLSTLRTVVRADLTDVQLGRVVRAFLAADNDA